jgi:hypothetical protein
VDIVKKENREPSDEADAHRPDSAAISLLYDEAIRARQLSAATLDELRTRVGTSVAVIALTTTFLGTLATTANKSIVGKPIEQAALGFFLLSALILAVLLNPIQGWKFWADPKRVRLLIQTRGMSTDDVRVKFAQEIEDGVDSDDKRLTWMQRAYTAALVAFVTEIVLFLIGILGPS